MRPIHSYPSSQQELISKITGTVSEPFVDKAYWNAEGKFFWFINKKGYYHIFKPAKFKTISGEVKFGLKELMLQDDGYLRELNHFKFGNSNEAVNFLKQHYKLDY